MVHWDGKMLLELTGHEQVERLPIIISHSEGEQLLGVPKLSASTGLEMSNATFNLLTEWKIDDQIVAACFDTTASNSGRLNGAAVLLEQLLGRSLLYLPCRHHISEIFLRAAFESGAGTTSGTNVPLFVRFKFSWNNIQHHKFKFGVTNSYVAKQVNDKKEEIIDFCQTELSRDHARTDYVELLELTLLFLGSIPEGHHFRLPGPMHHARWMSKAIYTLKIYMFREEFKLSTGEEKYLRDISIFIVRFYVQFWFRATVAVEAPNQDLKFIRDIYNYKEVNEKISTAVLKKACKHLWYLADENIALALFDDNVSYLEKQQMAEQLLALHIDDENDISIKRLNLIEKDLPMFITKELSDFITAKTVQFFDRFKISRAFLTKDPSKWHDDEDFLNAKKKLNKLKVVNDTAERGVKLMQDYNKNLTTKESEFQNLLQVVKEYTSKFPFNTKKSLTN